jgi:hypothetical protein
MDAGGRDESGTEAKKPDFQMNLFIIKHLDSPQSGKQQAQGTSF